MSRYLPNGQRVILAEAKDYGAGYPVEELCMDCGWFGARFTGTEWASHKDRPKGPRFEAAVESHHSHGKCGICGKEGKVSTPWTFGHPVMTEYLWGPAFIKKEN